MNDKQKKQKLLEKWSRQIGYTASKLFNLSGRDRCQIRGKGLLITIQRWEDAINECSYISDNNRNESEKKESKDKGQVEQGKSTEKSKEETPEEKTEEEIEEMLDGLACKKTLEEKFLNEENEEILEDESFEVQVARIRETWKR